MNYPNRPYNKRPYPCPIKEDDSQGEDTEEDILDEQDEATVEELKALLKALLEECRKLSTLLKPQ